MKNQQIYYQKDLQDILKGACLLASGGGGTYSSAKNLVDHFVKSDYYSHSDTPSFSMVSKDEITENSYGVVVAYMGAPEALQNAKYPRAAVHAVENIQRSLKQEGKTLKYLVPVETGALSLSVPCLVAGKLNLTVVDGDGAGRAVPELTMLTFAAAGISVNPTVLANSSGYYIDLNIGGFDSHGSEAQESAAEAIENLARPIIGLNEFNQIAGLAIWVMNTEEIRKAVQIGGTVTRALETGKMIDGNDADGMIAFLKERFDLKAFKMFEGTFQEKGCKTVTEGGFDHGTIVLTNKSNTEEYTGIFQNETLLAWNSSSTSPIAMAPDSIAYFVDDQQKIYSNGDLLGPDGKLVKELKGKTVTVIGIAANEALRKVEEDKIAQPLFKARQQEGSLMKSFKKALVNLGYAGKYKKIEDIW